jgi:hypothetical protein
MAEFKMEDYAAMRMKSLDSLPTTWMSLVNITWSQKSGKTKSMYNKMPLI